MSVKRRAASHASRSARPASLITIILADDQNLIRGGIRCLVEMQEDFKVVGEVADGLKVVGLVGRLKPRILIVAVAMSGVNGLEITRLVRQRSPATAVIVLSMNAKEQYVIQALRNGAWGYVVNNAKPAELVRAIRPLSERGAVRAPPDDLAAASQERSARRLRDPDSPGA